MRRSSEGQCERRGGRDAGFTIIEMMVVVVILTVIAMIAVPTFRGAQNTDRLVKAGNEIVGAFELARGIALRQNAAVRIVVRGASTDSTPNLRVDVSPDSSCTGWARIADPGHPRSDPSENIVTAACSTWRDTERHRCGVYQAHVTGTLSWGGYREADVRITGIDVGGVPMTDFVLCMNRRGRLLMQSGTTWVPVTGGIWFTLDRAERDDLGGAGSTALRLNRRVFVPQGGVGGVAR